jgi:hypothetical protein
VPASDTEQRANLTLNLGPAPDRSRFGESLEDELRLLTHTRDPFRNPVFAQLEFARLTRGDRRRELVGGQPLLELAKTRRDASQGDVASFLEIRTALQALERFDHGPHEPVGNDRTVLGRDPTNR